jgi:acetylornithine deacetylase
MGQGAIMARPVEESDVWRICRTLVGFDTASDASNVEAAQFLASCLEEVGWTVHLHRHTVHGVAKANLVAWAGPPVPGGLILCGHMDVVRDPGETAWSRDPLALTRDQHRLYGRGVADMKAFLAQVTAVARSLDSGRLQRPLVLLFTCDEEEGCQGCARLLPRLDSIAGLPPLPRAAMIGEPTSFRLFRANKGHLRFAVTVRGKAGHSSRPDLGINAVAAAAEAARGLQVLAHELDELVSESQRGLFADYPGIACNIGRIEGGGAVNVVPERCHLWVGMRPLPGMDVEGLLEQVEERMRRCVTTRFPGATLRIDQVVVTPAMESPTDTPLARALIRLSGEGEPVGAPFATEGGHLEKAGISSYICGPGEIEQAHKANESLPIRNLVKGEELIEQVIRELCL